MNKNYKTFNIDIDDGLVPIVINKDESRTIYINVNDQNILQRLNQSQKNIEALLSAEEFSSIEFDNETGNSVFESQAEIIKILDEKLRDEVNKIFNADISDKVFGKTFPLSTYGGKTYIERFIDSMQPVLTSIIKDEQKKSEERMSKYTNKYIDKDKIKDINFKKTK